MVFCFATVQGQNIQWFLHRNRAVTPVQPGWFYLSLGLAGVAICVGRFIRPELRPVLAKEIRMALRGA